MLGRQKEQFFFGTDKLVLLQNINILPKQLDHYGLLCRRSPPLCSIPELPFHTWERSFWAGWPLVSLPLLQQVEQYSLLLAGDGIPPLLHQVFILVHQFLFRVLFSLSRRGGEDSCSFLCTEPLLLGCDLLLGS